ncbi:MAG: lactonase family protein [Blastocatellia bacterium]
MIEQDLTRRNFIHLAATATAGAALFEPARAAAGDFLLYVGTYTKGKSEGIYIYRMNGQTGELKPVATVRDVSNPSFLAIDPRRKFLYAVNESGQFNGKPGGGVTAYAIDPKTGDLKKLNDRPSPGVPCHLSVHPSGRFVLAANYGGGNVVMYPVNADGSLGALSYVAQHTGKGGDPKRQDGPHAHCVMLDAAGRFAFAPDLGIDKIMIYKVDTAAGKLLLHGVAPTRPAAGPRHFDFHPSGNFAYVINELDSTITAFAYSKAKGTLTALQTVSALPEGYAGTSYCADIHVHPSGRFLYGSNRGHDSIVAFLINNDGRLSILNHEPVGGKWPRNFGIDPAGNFLLVANQNSDNVVTFRIDPATGWLKPTGQSTEVPMPVCLKFIPAPA